MLVWSSGIVSVVPAARLPHPLEHSLCPLPGQQPNSALASLHLVNLTSNDYRTEQTLYVMVTWRGSPHIWIEHRPSRTSWRISEQQLRARLPLQAQLAESEKPPIFPPLLASALHPELVYILSHGCVFVLYHGRLTENMLEQPKPVLGKLGLLIGLSPHTQRPFFRRDTSGYDMRLDNLDDIYVLDKRQGCIAHFARDGTLLQCIEPTPPPDRPLSLPLRAFDLYLPSRRLHYHPPPVFYLLDAAHHIVRWEADPVQRVTSSINYY